ARQADARRVGAREARPRARRGAAQPAAALGVRRGGRAAHRRDPPPEGASRRRDRAALQDRRAVDVTAVPPSLADPAETGDPDDPYARFLDEMDELGLVQDLEEDLPPEFSAVFEIGR